MNSYDEAHLITAAIRILLYQKQSPPTIEDICLLLDISVEAGLSTCRSLEKSGIVEISQDPFSIKISIANHLNIEDLPKTMENNDSLAKELKQFMNKKQAFDQKVDAIKADLKQKRQNLHSDMEEKLKQEMMKLKGNS